MTTHTILKPEKVVRDLSATLPYTYFRLLLINLPYLILFFIIPVLLPIFGTISERIYDILIYFGRFQTLYFLLDIFYFVLIYPYLQGVSILYTNHYLDNGNHELSKPYKKARKIFFRLFFGHFAVFFRIALLTLILSIVVIPLTLILPFIIGLSRGSTISLILTAIAFIIIIFYSSKFILLPHFLIFTRQNIAKCFLQNRQIIKNNEIRIFLLLLVGIIISFVLELGVASLSEIIPRMKLLAPSITLYLCQPLFIVISVIVYRHLLSQSDRIN